MSYNLFNDVRGREMAAGEMTADQMVSGHDAALMAEMLEPRLTERPAARPCPPVRLPRSARRTYTLGEQCVAAEMLAQLRQRSDLRRLAADAAALRAADHALDMAAERLLRVL